MVSLPVSGPIVHSGGGGGSSHGLLLGGVIHPMYGPLRCAIHPGGGA